jgi:glycosyltransferase involved in cell wall biosynthesis
VNHYPLTSHSFIRREIRGLEAHGVHVLRFSIRPPEQVLPTQSDRLEQRRTRVILSAGLPRIAAAVVALSLRRPMRFLGALALAARLGWGSDRGMLRHLAYLAEACVLARWLARAGVDHVHAHFGTNPAAVAAICHALGGPGFSFTVHGPVEFDRPEALRLAEKIRRSAFVVAVSSFGRGQLLRWAREEDWAKVQVVRCGLDEDLLRAEPTEVPDVPRLVCIARLDEQKGHLLLLDAVSRLAADGLQFEVVLVGDGPLRGRIERTVRDAGLEHHIRLLGWTSGDEVRKVVLASRALVLPSLAEGLPVVLMEALALGRPVITTAVAGIPELVEPGVSGWLLPSGSSEVLEHALRDVLHTPVYRLAEMGRAGKAVVARNHDAVREAGKLVRLFRSAVRGIAIEPAARAEGPAAHAAAGALARADGGVGARYETAGALATVSKRN